MSCDVCGDENCQCHAAEKPVDGGAEWRHEVAARLNRYQSRRKPRPPRYPSLLLRFEDAMPPAAEREAFPPSSPQSHQALALQDFQPPVIDQPAQEPWPSDRWPEASVEIPAPTAKIIEFPRSWTPSPPAADELAEPVVDQPRILEAPEIMPPPPALGGITIEPLARPEPAKRPGIDVPLQSASLTRRVAAAAIDGVMVSAACALFGYVFWKMTAVRPPKLALLEMGASLASAFWAAYQYLLLVYAGTTPGLRLARLQLARFDGSGAGRKLRRWRVLASFLSAVSLGMGYAWLFLDEDGLCWHDRITHTYLSPQKSAN